MDGVPVSTVLAFDNPWHIAALIGVAVSLRLWAAHSHLFRLLPGTHSSRAGVLEFIDSLLIALLLVFCVLRPFVVQAFFIPSGSMEPTLQVCDRILVNKFIYYFSDPEPGDIIVFRAPPAADHLERDFIKRAVGASGDHIAVYNEKLHRNGVAIEEDYLAEPPYYRWPVDDNGYLCEQVVSENHLLVFGDNRNDSNDSHRWHAIKPNGRLEARPLLPRENVKGKAMMIFWPLNRLSLTK